MISRSSASEMKKGVCNLEARCVGHASAASPLSSLEVQFVDQLLQLDLASGHPLPILNAFLPFALCIANKAWV